MDFGENSVYLFRQSAYRYNIFLVGFSPLCGRLRHGLDPSVLDNGEGEAPVEPVNEAQRELRPPSRSLALPPQEIS